MNLMVFDGLSDWYMSKIDSVVCTNHNTLDYHKRLQEYFVTCTEYDGAGFYMSKLVVVFCDAVHEFDQWLSISPWPQHLIQKASSPKYPGAQSINRYQNSRQFGWPALLSWYSVQNACPRKPLSRISKSPEHVDDIAYHANLAQTSSLQINICIL